MDVKSTSGRQRHNLILFPYFWHANFYCTLLDLPILLQSPVCRGVAWNENNYYYYYYYYQLGHLLTRQNQSPQATWYRFMHISVCMLIRQRRKATLYVAFLRFLMVVYFYS